MNLYPNAKYPLELVEADLMHPNSWKAAVAECTYVIHMASPVPIKQPKNEDDVIQPAVQGYSFLFTIKLWLMHKWE